MLFGYFFDAFKRGRRDSRNEIWRREEIAGAARFRQAADDIAARTENDDSSASRAPSAEEPNSIRYRLRTASVIAAIALGFGGAAYFALSDGAENPSRLARVPPMDTTPGGQRQRESERYQETLQAANELNAEYASQEGMSFIPIPEELTTDINPPLEIGVEPQADRSPGELERNALHAPNLLNETFDNAGANDPPVAAPAGAIAPLIVPSSENDQAETVELSFEADRAATNKPNPTDNSSRIREPAVRAADQAKSDNSHRSAIIGQMNAIARGLAIRPPKGEIFIARRQARNHSVPSREPTSRMQADQAMQTDIRADGDRAGDLKGEKDAIGSRRISAGTILYGETLNAADSDYPAPIVAEIKQGPNKGLRLVGRDTAAPDGKGFAIEFDTLVSPNGSMQPASAVGLDGFDGDLDAAGRRYPRILERYGLLLASSFITGYARSAARTGSSVVVANGSAILETEKPGSKEHLYSALGEAGSQLATDLAARAPKGPKIVLEAGYPLGILFVETVDIDPSAWR